MGQQVPRERIRAPSASAPPGVTVPAAAAAHVGVPGRVVSSAHPAASFAPPGVTGISSKPPDVPNPFAGTSSNIPPPPAGTGGAAPHGSVVAGAASTEDNPMLEM